MRSRTYWLVVLLLGGLGFAFRWPALRTGFIVDDYAQLSMMQGTYPVPRAPLALFTFSDGSLRENDVLRATGFFPWWSQSNLRISLFRPLASALMWVDRALFGTDAFAYHLHSAGWWVLMIAVWAAVLQQLLPRGIALVALALCLLHPAHSVLLGWIASRNAIVSTLFALLGLSSQLRRRERSDAGGAALTWASYAAALAASEYALGFLIFALLLEWELGRDAAERRKRLLPPLGLLAGYGVLRGALGFGARASGMYIDPIAEPRAFVEGAFSRLPVLAGDLVFGVRSNWWGGGYPQAARVVAALKWPLSWVLDVRPWRVLEVLLGALALITMWAFARSVRRAAKRSPRPELGFAASGLLLALLPYLGGFPEGRLLLPGLFGWTVVLGQFAAARLPPSGEARSWRTRLALGVVAGLVLLEGITSYGYSSDDTRDLPRIAGAVRASILAPELDAALAGARRAMLVSAVDPTTTIYVPLVRRWYGRPAPEQCHLLLSAFSQTRLERSTDRSFTLERLQTEYTAPDAYATVFNREALHDGDRFDAGGLRATVERTFEGRPMRVRYELDVSLDDPTAVLLLQTLQGLQQLRFPPPGQSILLPPPLLPFGLIPPSN